MHMTKLSNLDAYVSYASTVEATRPRKALTPGMCFDTLGDAYAFDVQIGLVGNTKCLVLLSA